MPRYTDDFDPYLVSLVLHQFHDEAAQLHLAITELNAQLTAGIDGLDLVRFWFHLDSALSLVARMSALIWPLPSNNRVRRERSESRGRMIRARFDLPDIPFLDREVRNMAEHVDEYLDKWHHESILHNQADMFVDERESLHVGIDIDIVRAYIADERVIIRFGVELDFGEAMRQISIVAAQLPRSIDEYAERVAADDELGL